MTANTPASRKAKGRRLQKEVARAVIDHFNLPEDDVRPVPMGVSGEDLWLSDSARKLFPFSCEMKYTERLNLWQALKQCEENANGHIPLLVFRKNGEPPRCVIRLDDLLDLL